MANPRFGMQTEPCPTCSGSKLVGRGVCSKCASKEKVPCGCGRLKSKDSPHCRVCGGKLNRANRIPGIKANPYCPNNADGSAVCETQHPHHHCDCGWPIRLDQTVCHICIAEQSRLEFKRWPTEEVAA